MARDLFRSSLTPAVSWLAPLLPGILLFAVLLGLARIFDTFPGDQWALMKLREMRSPCLNDAAIALSVFGQGGIGWGIAAPWIPVAAIAAVMAARRWADATFLALAFLAPLMNLGLKELAARPRPDAGLSLVMETGLSFPSGHSVFVAAFLGALAWMMGRSNFLAGHAAVRWAAQALLLAVILAVGFSRVYLGVHWPSDVIGGFLFGGLYLSLLIAVRRLLEKT